MKTGLLKTIADHQRFLNPSIIERYINACEIFGPEFDADEALFRNYTELMFGPKTGAMMCELYKRKKG